MPDSTILTGEWSGTAGLKAPVYASSAARDGHPKAVAEKTMKEQIGRNE
jgi:hypothetical protein